MSDKDPLITLLALIRPSSTKERRKKNDGGKEAKEISAANAVSSSYGQQADFSIDEDSLKHHKDVLFSVLQYRLCDGEWLECNPSSQLIASFVQVARILFRDRELQDQFFQWKLASRFAQLGEHTVHRYFSSSNSEDASFGTAVIRGFLSICQKLCNSEAHISTLAENGLHKVSTRTEVLSTLHVLLPMLMETLFRDFYITAQSADSNCIALESLVNMSNESWTVLRLLTARDMVVVQATLQFLALLSEQSSSARLDLCSTNALDQCLQLLKDSDLLSQKYNCFLQWVFKKCEVEARESVKVYDGVPVIVGLLSTKNVRLQWHLAWTLAQLAEDEEVSAEMGHLGAVPLILSELGDISESKTRNLDDWLTMLTGLAAVLAQLCHVDTNAQLIVQDNGIYVLCKTLLAQLDFSHWYKNRNYYLLQCSIFRVLRLLFSLERNRQFFKRLFPSEFFAKFIDIGHYVVELNAYESLVQEFHEILKISGSDIQHSVELINQRRAPLSYIGNYAVLEQLGVGAFGCVYKVQKKSGANQPAESQQLFALKEIFMHQTTFEKDGKDKSFGDIISEVKIIRQQLRHPNIVRYRRVFVENDKLYILMDLIDGASLKEHVCSVKEKGQTFPEERIWNILIQMVLALRYLHKEKHIIHRDLKPNNVMLADNDRVVITDFGLAKQRGESYLKSAAGTIIYSCPEILQNEPYGEKSDIWSLGCIVYEMAALKPPFYSQNMLQLASAIVEARYDPIPTNVYSAQLRDLVSSCLCPSPSDRPDVVGVAQLMSDHLLQFIDGVRHQQKVVFKSQSHYSKPRELGDTSGSSLNASLTSFTSSNSGLFPGGRHASSQSEKDTGMMEEEEAPSQSPQQNRPMRAQIRPRGALPKSAGDKSGGGGSRIPRSRSLSSRRIRRTMSCNALPVLDSVQQFSTGSQEKGGKKFAWPDQTSGEPLVLPTIRRANSSSVVDKQRRNEPLRVHSAGSTISVSSAKLREIQDPILELLAVLHRVMFVSLMPPGDTVDHKRRVVEQFAKAIFAGDSAPIKIKAELRKLLSQSTDMVSVSLGFSDYRPVLDGILVDFTQASSKEKKVPFLTYEQLYACLECVLNEKHMNVDLQYKRPPSRLLTPRVKSP